MKSKTRKFFTLLSVSLSVFNFSENTIAQPAICTAAIGLPANGTAHYITVTWSPVSGVSSYELESSLEGNNWNLFYSDTDTFYHHNTGRIGNLPHYYRVRSVINGVPSPWVNAAQNPVYSACDFPALPQLSNAGFYSITLSIMPESPDTNPSYTTYSIHCLTNGQYVQPNGTLGAGEIFQTRAAWGTVNITGLAHSTDYCFYLKAKNNDGDTRMGSDAIMNPETFNTSANFTTSSAVTNKFWSPAACNTGGLIYSTSGGCTGGYVGYRRSFNNKFNCWLRVPEQNCMGSSSVVLKMDVSNSYFSDHPEDKIQFYVRDNNASSPAHYDATSIKINGVESGVADLNGMWLKFDQERTCVNVEVTYDFVIANIPNLDKLLFYIHPNCGYHDGKIFSFKLDNISLQRSPSTTCISTAICNMAAITTQPVSRNACPNTNTSFDIITSGNVASYQWQVSVNNGSSWSDISNNGIYLNTNTSILTVIGVTSGMNGFLYRCNITGSCSADLISNSAILQLTNYTPAAAGSINGSTSICHGQNSVAYSVQAVNGADTYSWSLPSGATMVSGNSTNSITVSFGNNAQSGNIIVTPGNSCGQGASSPVFYVIVNPLPLTPSDISGNASVCGNSTEVYSVAPVNGASSYNWTLPTGWSGTSSIETITVITNGTTGTILVNANNSCGSSSAKSLMVTGGVGPGIPATINGPVSVCAGSLLTLSVQPLNGATFYTWTLPSGWTGASATNSIAANVGNNGGTVSVIAGNNCGTSNPQNKTLTVNPKPAVLFDFNRNMVCSSEASFTLNATPANGIFTGNGVSNGMFYPANVSPGNHVITYDYVDVNGCSSSDTSGILVEVCSGINSVKENAFDVFPNPFSNHVLVKFSVANQIRTLVLYDAVGKEVRRMEAADILNEIIIDANHEPSRGIFFLKVISANESFGIRKLIRI